MFKSLLKIIVLCLRFFMLLWFILIYLKILIKYRIKELVLGKLVLISCFSMFLGDGWKIMFIGSFKFIKSGIVMLFISN